MSEPDPKRWGKALQFARLMRKAGTSRDDALPRVQRWYDLTDTAIKALGNAVWGTTKEDSDA